MPFTDDYERKERKRSGGYESVRVVEDRGDFISLQHILTARPDDSPVIVKHWRQDWQFEPARVLTLIGGNAWEWRDVTNTDRVGARSQTVYRVDTTLQTSDQGDLTVSFTEPGARLLLVQHMAKAPDGPQLMYEATPQH